MSSFPNREEKENIPMACFLVPAAEAVVITAVKAGLEKSAAANSDPTQTKRRLELVQKISWLANLLWGGAVLLAFEHLWHNEVVPWFPFLTAAADPGDTAQMLHEMSTVGVTMAVLVTVVWGGAVVATNAIRRRSHTEA
ncbi:hypothetical protein [Mobiluncus mulieris]|uniref:hypothetical protein n=1 Tax=Mobiluncus mulieris TaxID=2052 RepID=UPI00019F9660|nr:hypothetical protein [Mobiluncus mulieris]EEJ52929.1 hypothetical protein HMPREF0577_2242 [Mobiluncus mulieris ATCC 35243]